MIAMFDQIILVCFFLLCLWGSYRIGRARGRVVERNTKPKPIRPICPCEHTLGAHKDGGKCQATVQRPRYNVLGNWNGYEYHSCACTKYYGPAVVTEEFFHPGVTTIEE